jgi:hypothetical protein
MDKKTLLSAILNDAALAKEISENASVFIEVIKEVEESAKWKERPLFWDSIRKCLALLNIKNIILDVPIPCKVCGCDRTIMEVGIDNVTSRFYVVVSNNGIFDKFFYTDIEIKLRDKDVERFKDLLFGDVKKVCQYGLLRTDFLNLCEKIQDMSWLFGEDKFGDFEIENALLDTLEVLKKSRKGN